MSNEHFNNACKQCTGLIIKGFRVHSKNNNEPELYCNKKSISLFNIETRTCNDFEKNFEKKEIIESSIILM